MASHLTVKMGALPIALSPSSTLALNGRIGGTDESNLPAVPTLLSSSTLHHTLSRQSFASDTDLLSHPDHRSTSMARASISARSDSHVFDQTSRPFHYQDTDLGADTGRIQQRTALRRQGTDDFVTSVVMYNQSQTPSRPSGLHSRDNSIESGFKESHDMKVKSDSKAPDEGYGLAATTEHGQLDALRKARDWRRVSPLYRVYPFPPNRQSDFQLCSGFLILSGAFSFWSLPRL